MEFVWLDKTYPVVIEKKRTTKNLYIKVRDDASIYVTCNLLTRDKEIEKLIQGNYEKIGKMIEKRLRLLKEKESFYFLGKQYDIVYTNGVSFQLGEEKVFMERDFSVDKWLKKQALSIFKERLDMCYNAFSRDIPYPSLRIRSMKTRWGVCNTKDKVVTLNLELIKKDIKYLDYVIFHELSHLIHPNHSASFWNLVGENCKDFKKLRKELNA